MTKRELDSKINQVKRYLSYAQRYSKIFLKQLEEDLEKRLAIERILFLVAQSSIDLAESYCRLKSFERPNSMHESIEMLEPIRKLRFRRALGSPQTPYSSSGLKLPES